MCAAEKGQQPLPRRMEYKPAQLDMLDLAWATTVHKAQGSEARVVILLLTRNRRLNSRRLLYTGASPSLHCSEYQRGPCLINVRCTRRRAVRQAWRAACCTQVTPQSGLPVRRLSCDRNAAHSTAAWRALGSDAHPSLGLQ